MILYPFPQNITQTNYALMLSFFLKSWSKFFHPEVQDLPLRSHSHPASKPHQGQIDHGKTALLFQYLLQRLKYFLIS